MMDTKRSSNKLSQITIVGVGMTSVSEHWGTSLRELALQAIDAARQDAPGFSPQAMFVANMLAPALSRQSQLGALLADFSGMRGIEAMSVEAAGASGGAALRQAILAISSGQIDCAMVVGVEKVTERVSAELEAARITSGDADYEAVHGVTVAAQAAMLMRRYIHEFNVPRESFGGFSLTAHANAVSNPYAMFRRAINIETYNKAAMVSEPVNMFDAAPLADGAAAVILARKDVLPKELPHPRVEIAASSATIEAVAVHDRSDPLSLSAAAQSVHQAYGQSDIGPDAIDFFEPHDLFSIYTALALEAGGFAEKGQAWKLAQYGAIAMDGEIPICTFGGSKARGDTGGATGVYQAAEAILQLQGRAAENQIEDAKVGMVQCLGGTGATAVTHIFRRAETS